MIRFQYLCVGAFLVALCASAASAAPVDILFDGNVDPNVTDFYFHKLPDDIAEAPFESTSWDVAAAYLDMDDDWLYMGLDTVGPFDPNGGDTSFLRKETQFFGVLIPSPDVQYVFELSSNDDGITLKLNGIVLTDDQYDALRGTDLEIRISLALLTDLGLEFFMQAQLDDTGFGQDDQIAGQITLPEPGTIALLSLGGVALALRRRRSRA